MRVRVPLERTRRCPLGPNSVTRCLRVGFHYRGRAISIRSMTSGRGAYPPFGITIRRRAARRDLQLDPRPRQHRVECLSDLPDPVVWAGRFHGQVVGDADHGKHRTTCTHSALAPPHPSTAPVRPTWMRAPLPTGTCPVSFSAASSSSAISTTARSYPPQLRVSRHGHVAPPISNTARTVPSVPACCRRPSPTGTCMSPATGGRSPHCTRRPPSRPAPRSSR
jgi:hypothetical protein